MEQGSATHDPAEKNVRAIVNLERSKRIGRTRLECVIDRSAKWAGHPSFPIAHALWFGPWLVFNLLSPRAFDPYPFTLLTLLVSLEAILLTSFVLAAQDRMTKDADERAKLNLQVDILAEQELTAILRGIAALAQHSGVELAHVIPNLPELTSDTRIDRLAERLAEAEQDARDR